LSVCEIATEIDPVLLRASIADVFNAQPPALQSGVCRRHPGDRKRVFHAYQQLAGADLVVKFYIDLVDDSGPECARLELAGGHYCSVGCHRFAQILKGNRGGQNLNRVPVAQEAPNCDDCKRNQNNGRQLPAYGPSWNRYHSPPAEI
jgi:hypothetical protein